MNDVYKINQRFTSNDVHRILADKGEYEDCIFSACDFESADLTSIRFINCLFEDCNFSSAHISGSMFDHVRFLNCKMLGLSFHECNPFAMQMDFKDSILDHSSFYQMKVSGFRFQNVSLREVDFVEADLSDLVFENCDLSDAVFENCKLIKTDFRTAYNYIIDLEKNNSKKALFSREGLGGLLSRYDIVIE
jgi:fluoroquinolone resistance protein